MNAHGYALIALCMVAGGCASDGKSLRSPPPSAPMVPCPNIVVRAEGDSKEPVWEELEEPAPSNVARFIGGEIHLPRGWTHVCTRGGRGSQTGYFAGPDNLRIDYDVGGFNPILTQEPGDAPIKHVQTERVGGVPLQYGYREGTRLYATFLMVRPANFVADVMDDGESEQVLGVLKNLKPSACALRTCRASASQMARAFAHKRDATAQAAR